jgi:cell division protein FtsI/penicillin-binding protein 2
VAPIASGAPTPWPPRDRQRTVTAPAASSSPRLRLTIVAVVVGCLFAALFARLWFLQVVNASAATSR